MTQQLVMSWGRSIRAQHDVCALSHRTNLLPEYDGLMLPYGNGRSYGDSPLNDGGLLLKTTSLDRFISFDPTSGVLRCEAGLLLADVLKLVVPQGWFLPVTPGTRFVTVGGAVANDVHGKNHHVMGTFGHHVRSLELVRSDQSRLLCSDQHHAQLFHATIGGLGLTGLITWVELQLRRIINPWMNIETIRYRNLAEFFALCTESDQDYEYTVSWVDCTRSGRDLGRGLFMRANHACADIPKHLYYQEKNITFPFSPPISCVNRLSLKAFNFLYYNQQISERTTDIQHYQPFFYPLDGVLEWNKMYGPKGFYQYQCIIPIEVGQEAVTALLEQISQSGTGSFLAVLKICGNLTSKGMLSFPKHGVSLALDFPNHGEKTKRLFAQLDQIVEQAKGRLYPAKDACMPAHLFQSGYPQWQAFSHYIDPCFSSSFWRRVTESV